MLHNSRAKRLLVAIAFAIALLPTISYIAPPLHGVGETYILTPSPSRIQESDNPGVSLVLSVNNATGGASYSFTWTVTDPNGILRSAGNSTVATGSSFTLSVVYPRHFATTIIHVGNYSVNVEETSPSSNPSVATAQFEVGLADSKTYQRTYQVLLKAQGYNSNENVTVNIARDGAPATGFPAWQLADGSGVVSYQWRIPASVPTGIYTATLVGTTTPPKTPPDSETFTVHPTNVTITGLTVSQTSIQRTMTQELFFTGTYTSGTPVQSGSTTIRLTEPDGTGLQYATASYNSTLESFRGTYPIPLIGQTGSWLATVPANSFDDGYGNRGPATTVSAGFMVTPATLSVTVIVANRTYAVGDVIAIYATVTAPDGRSFDAGTVAASAYRSGSRISQTVLSYVQGQTQWVGSIVVNASHPSGTWVIEVEASDTYGNAGRGSTSSLVSITPPAPAPQTLDLFYFALAVLSTIGSIITIVVASRMAVGRFGVTTAPFEEFFTLTGGQLQPPATLLIIGDPGSGTTTLGLQLICRELLGGKWCGVLTYDSFPSEVQRTMQGLGCDVSSHFRNGRLGILDCYSALAGDEKAAIRDPTDLTEVSIQVSSMIEKAAKGPITILLDSITPIFNSVQAKQAVNFLRVLGAKVKNSGGLLIVTGTKSSLQEDTRFNLEAFADGVVELGLARTGEMLTRTLMVKKLAGRSISSRILEFEIVGEKGILFRKQRFSFGRRRSK